MVADQSDRVIVTSMLDAGIITLRISGEIELGPLEEKSATIGASTDFPILVLAGFICNGGKLYGPEYERQASAGSPSKCHFF